MSRYYYGSGNDRSFAICDTAKLLNVASHRYGDDRRSVPHTHNHTELFLSSAARGSF